MKYKGYNIELIDDGTLDTVISVNGVWQRLDTGSCLEYRLYDGSFDEIGLIEILEAFDLLDIDPPIREE